MSRICVGSEGNAAGDILDLANEEEDLFDTDESIALSAIFTANHLEVKAIAALTESGSTPRPDVAFPFQHPDLCSFPQSRDTSPGQHCTEGCTRSTLRSISTDHAELNRDLVEVLKKSGVVEDGDRVIITKGDLAGVQGGTNALKIVGSRSNARIAGCGGRIAIK